ncbi:MAG: sodium:calcium antiporter, partial [SAR202 cluster bacterium]|nr:sodium:calcium antiporter [SAR202 cluster bacterium]
MEFALLVVGLALLVAGAESLVRGASRIAAALGISPLIVGLTVVAFGTSAPEIAVSVGSVLRGDSDIAVGNVVGSNIFNVLFILGVAVAIGGLVVHQRLVRVDDPIVIGVSVAVLALSLDGHIGRVEAGLLVAAMGGYTLLQVRAARRPSSEPG